LGAEREGAGRICHRRRGEEVSFHFNMRPSQRSRSVSEGRRTLAECLKEVTRLCARLLSGLISNFCKYTQDGNEAEFPAFAEHGNLQAKHPLCARMTQTHPEMLEKMGYRADLEKWPFIVNQSTG
jgi:hypothetical protein